MKLTWVALKKNCEEFLTNNILILKTQQRFKKYIFLLRKSITLL